MPIDSHKIMQVAVVVRDIEKAVGAYAELFGMEKPGIFRLCDLGDDYAEFYGVPTPAEVRLAVFKMGQVDLELIEPDDHPSTFKKFLDERGEGVHNIGVVVRDKASALECLREKGVAVRHFGRLPGATYYHMDTERLLGVVLNIKHSEEA